MGKYFTDEMANEAKKEIADLEELIAFTERIKTEELKISLPYPEENSYWDKVLFNLKSYLNYKKIMLSVAGY